MHGDDRYCVLMHADGAGTKSALAYLHYRVHRDVKIFCGIAQDSFVMNLDDLVSVGATGPFVFANIINRNAKRVGEEVLQTIIEGYQQFSDLLAEYEIEAIPCGGETADVGDLVRTLVVDSVLTCRMRRADYIDCSLIRPGLVIVGLSSFGQAIYEEQYSSGIGSNGFTSARHEVLGARYRVEFPETYSPDITELAYTGEFQLDDKLPGTNSTIGDALLAPTRTYAPIVKRILRDAREGIIAIVHNTGGGQTKCLNFGDSIRYVKDNLFDPPPIFSFMAEKVGIPIYEMFRVFNMGHRLELYCQEEVAGDIISIAKEFGVDARVVGRTERTTHTARNELFITSGSRTLTYSRETTMG